MHVRDFMIGSFALQPSATSAIATTPAGTAARVMLPIMPGPSSGQRL